MKVITRAFRSLNEEDTVTAKEQSKLANKILRQRFSPSVFLSWLKSADSKMGDEIAVNERQMLSGGEYKLVVQSLRSMVDNTCGVEHLVNRKFLCNSSAYVHGISYHCINIM
jgi:hypothetical protein